MTEIIKDKIYRLIMKVAHKFNWHYAPPIYFAGEKQLWCNWCGQEIKKERRDKEIIELKGKNKKLDDELKSTLLDNIYLQKTLNSIKDFYHPEVRQLRERVAELMEKVAELNEKLREQIFENARMKAGLNGKETKACN